MRGFDIWRLRVIYECIIMYYCTDCTENNVHIWEVLIITLNKALIFDLPLLTYIRKGLPASSFASSLPLSTTPASSNPNTIAAKKDLSLAHSGATQLQKCENVKSSLNIFDSSRLQRCKKCGPSGSSFSSWHVALGPAGCWKPKPLTPAPGNFGPKTLRLRTVKASEMSIRKS